MITEIPLTTLASKMKSRELKKDLAPIQPAIAFRPWITVGTLVFGGLNGLDGCLSNPVQPAIAFRPWFTIGTLVLRRPERFGWMFVKPGSARYRVPSLDYYGRDA